ncbi:tail fiber domain-containing protein [Hyphomicrobium sp.]|uniref:tail fiber domain-containing protein n=1 Tax=Hyphomicrobium sp. TaxID=82 RepID=UPI002E37A043|nr:tail fiber domain-containing protein [Hyphomicrobium sp.]HEX2842103.1 tail fiber domain-containing protein [Hyphomicrobium sp.]
MALAAAWGNTQDWGNIAVISDTMGNNAGRLCVGEGLRVSDIGCPSYAPSVSTAGHVSVTGNLSASKFIGDGSLLTGISNASGDRIVSGTGPFTQMIAVSDTRYISITQGGNNTGWFDPTRGLVSLGISTTGPISGTDGYFSGKLGIGTGLVPPAWPIHVSDTFPIVMLDHAATGSSNAAFHFAENGASRWALSNLNGAYASIPSLQNALTFYQLSNKAGSTLNTYRMVITDDGNVGIGTAAPNAALQVSGTFVVSTSSQGTNSPSLFVASNGAVGVGTSSPSLGAFPTMLHVMRPNNAWGLVVDGDGATQSDIIMRTRGNAADQRLLQTVNVLNKVYMRSLSDAIAVRFNYWTADLATGALGISNTSPIAKLDVNGTISSSDAIQVGQSTLACATGISGSIRFNTTSDTLQVCTGFGWKSLVSGTAGVGTLAGTGSATAVAFWNGASGLTYDTDGFYWDSSNNRLGIGTNAPSATLNISATLPVLAIDRRAGAFGMLHYRTNGSLRWSLFADQSAESGSESGSNFGINAYDDAGAYISTPLTVRRATGNVGIQNLAPAATLQVSGSFIVSTSAQTTTPSLFVGLDGKVGFGTSTPPELLTLSSDAPRLQFQETDQAVDEKNWAFSISAGTFYGFTRTDDNSSGVNWLQVARDVGGSHTGIDNVVFPNGRVGIGITAPRASLNVSGTISSTNAIQVGSSTLTCSASIPGAIRYNGGILQFCNGTSWTSLSAAGGGLEDRIVSGTSSILTHQDRSLTFTTAGTQRMIVGENGGLGINITNPNASAALHISGTAGGTHTYMTNSASGGVNVLWFANNYPASPQYAGIGQNGSGSLRFAAAGNINDSNVGMVLTSGKQVGIGGVVTPAATLQVSGSFIVSSTDTGISPSLYVSASGRVGIRTLNPQGHLHIATDDATSSLYLSRAGDLTSAISFDSSLGNSLVAGGGSAGNLRFFSAGAQRMVLSAAGNVGIGAALLPAVSLSVVGEVQVSNSGVVCGATTRGAIRYTSGILQYCNSSAWTTLGAGGGGQDDRIISGTTSAIAWQDSSLTFTTNNVQQMIVARSGNVGIGTATPGRALEVSSTSYVRLTNGAATPAVAGLEIWGNSGGEAYLQYYYPFDQWRVFAGGGGPDNIQLVVAPAGVGIGAPGVTPTATLQVSGSFIVSTSAQTTTPSLYVGTNGNVGIGTSSPGTKLEVSGSIATAAGSGGRITAFDATAANNRVIMGADASGGYLQGTYGSGGTGTLRFLNINAEGMRLSGGRLGISNTNPIAKLDVNGTISASDAIQVGTSELVCSSAISGSIRYSTTSSTLEYCNSTAWTSLGPSDTQVVSFKVNKNGTNQTVTASTWTKLTWSSEVFDTNNNFDTGTSRFTPTVPGKYLVYLTVHCSGGGDCMAGIYKNGATNSFSITNRAANSYAYATTIIEMNGTTDYLEGWAYSAGTTIGGGAVNTHFEGALLGPQSGVGGGGGTANPAGGAGDIQFNDGSNLAADTGQFFWDATNNRMGLGNADPSYTLDVTGIVRSSSYGMFGTGTGAGSYIVGNNTYGLYRSNISNGYLGFPSNGVLSLMNANIGISTTTPLAKLDVVGTISASDAIQPGTSSLTCSTGIAGALRYSTASNTVQVCAGASGWKSLVSGTAATSLSELTDTQITNVAGRDYLRYDAVTSKWVNISESSVMSTTTMSSGWPDALRCRRSNGDWSIMYLNWSPSGTDFYYYNGEGYYNVFNPDGSYKTNNNFTPHASGGCNKNISQLYIDGQAFNFIGNANTNSTAEGDSITSGTLAMVANSATSYISLSTNGTDWGYLGSGASFLPAISANRVSSTNISATYIQLNSPSTVLACNSGFTGAMRYTSGTMQVCDGSNWGNIGIGVPTGTIAAFAASSCPSGWSEYTASRGRFLRGIDNGAGIDPAGTRAAGNQQADAMQQITGSVGFNRTAGSTFSGAFATAAQGSAGASPGSSAAGGLSFDSANSPGARTANETRPSNVAVTFCVYAGFQSAPGQTILTTLASLTDVSIAGASTGQVLAFNGASWVASNTTTGSGALGDRITSGTHAVAVNTSSGYINLSTSGTDWGYLSSGVSYLPTITASRVSSTNVSATYIQLNSPSTVLACNSGFTGAMRYTSGTMQVCDGSNWGNIGIGVPTGTIAAFATASCPSGWTEYTPARGRFLRGIDPTGTNDSVRAAGNTQTDAFQGHRHAILEGSNLAWIGNGTGNGNYAVGTNMKGVGIGDPNTDGTNGAPRTADETRPKNVAVTYCVYSGFQSAPGQTILTTLASLTDVSIAGASTGQVLAFNGASWVASNTTAGNANVASSTGAIQFNANGSSFGGDTANLFWNNATKRLGIGTSTPSYSLDVNGVVQATSFFQSSDRTLKDNIVQLRSGLATIEKLNPVTFDWKKDGKHAAGLIAQEVSSVIPAAVSANVSGTLSVDYSQIIPYLVKGMQELKSTNDKLERALRGLKDTNEKLERRLKLLEERRGEILN